MTTSAPQRELSELSCWTEGDVPPWPTQERSDPHHTAHAHRQQQWHQDPWCRNPPIFRLIPLRKDSRNTSNGIRNQRHRQVVPKPRGLHRPRPDHQALPLCGGNDQGGQSCRPQSTCHCDSCTSGAPPTCTLWLPTMEEVPSHTQLSCHSRQQKTTEPQFSSGSWHTTGPAPSIPANTSRSLSWTVSPCDSRGIQMQSWLPITHQS